MATESNSRQTGGRASVAAETSVLQYPIYQILHRIVEGTAAKTGSSHFRALVRLLAVALKVQLAFVTECTDESKTRVPTIAFSKGGSLQENIEYDLDGTPCAQVLEGKVCCYPDRVQELFPKEVGLRSYIGVPLVDACGELLGHLAILDDKPMPDQAPYASMLRICAARAGVELERKRSEAALRESEEPDEETPD